MFELVKARLRHGYQAIPNPLLAEINPAFPGCPTLAADADLQALAALCPTGAFSVKGLDLGKCTFCGACQRKYPKMIDFKPDFRLAADSREALIVAPGTQYVAKIAPHEIKLFRRSFAIRNVSAGGCNACELELGASTNVNFDMGRYGVEIVASPRHADALILTGPISRNMADALADTWEAIPAPKCLILCGCCAISSGVFAPSAQLDRSFLAHWPASIYIPGCPAHPLSIVHAIHSFMGVK